MKIFSLSVAALLLAVACSKPQQAQDVTDTTAALTDTLNIYSVYDDAPPIDTTYTVIKIAQKFNKPQIDKNIAYVYAKEGLDVYGGLINGSSVVGQIAYKSKVKLLEELKDEGVDNVVIDGLEGYTIEVEYEGGKGYVFSGYLLHLPVPETDQVTEYFTSTLHLAADPIQKTTNDVDEMSDATFKFTDYFFEGGFKVLEGSQYESGYTIVRLPGFSAQKAFLFASYFYESFRDSFTEFPQGARDEDLPEQKHITVRVDGGNVDGITVGNGEGCYWEDSIAVVEDGAVMNSEGGC